MHILPERASQHAMAVATNVGIQLGENLVTLP